MLSNFCKNFNIACYVTEEVLKLLKDDVDEKAETVDESSPHAEVDLDKLEIFKDSTQNKINRIITLGGDGTVVQAIKLFYKDKCPKMITFGQESIGYLCCFESEHYEEVLYSSLINIAEDKDEHDIESNIHANGNVNYGTPYVETRERVVLKVHFEDKDKQVKSSVSPNKTKKPKFGSLYALNQITIDRGSFNYLTNIE